MKKAVAVVLLVWLIFVIVLDPYTFHLTASDALRDAPWWQTGGAFTEVLLLMVSGVLLLRGTVRGAQALLGVATLLNLGLNVIYVGRDGVDRFVAGFGAQEFLSIYLFSVGVRIVLLVWVFHPPYRGFSSSVADPASTSTHRAVGPIRPH